MFYQILTTLDTVLCVHICAYVFVAELGFPEKISVRQIYSHNVNIISTYFFVHSNQRPSGQV